MVFTTFASDLLSCLLHLCSLVNLSKSIFSSSDINNNDRPGIDVISHVTWLEIQDRGDPFQNDGKLGALERSFAS